VRTDDDGNDDDVVDDRSHAFNTRHE